MLTITIDVAAYLLQVDYPALAYLTQFSEQLLHKPLTPSAQLISEIFAMLPYADGMAASAVQLGVYFAEFTALNSPGGGGGLRGLMG